MNTANNLSCRNGALAELADALLLGSNFFGSESSNLLCPTTNKTSEVTILEHKFVAQDVALKKKCCNECGESGVGNTLGGLRIEPHFTLTFITAYCSSIATSFN